MANCWEFKNKMQIVLCEKTSNALFEWACRYLDIYVASVPISAYRTINSYAEHLHKTHSHTTKLHRINDSNHSIKIKLKVGGAPQMFMQQGGVPMNAVRTNVGGGGMPMSNFGQAPNVLPGPLAFLEKTTSNIGKKSRKQL